MNMELQTLNFVSFVFLLAPASGVGILDNFMSSLPALLEFPILEATGSQRCELLRVRFFCGRIGSAVETGFWQQAASRAMKQAEPRYPERGIY